MQSFTTRAAADTPIGVFGAMSFTQLSTVKSRLITVTDYDDLLTNAIRAVSDRFDKETNRTLSRTTIPAPHVQPADHKCLNHPSIRHGRLAGSPLKNSFFPRKSARFTISKRRAPKTRDLPFHRRTSDETQKLYRAYSGR
jgi:hypothetical protein